MKSVFLYDTTLRDGSQRKGLSFSLEDKLKITTLLDGLGVAYIEGGWPGSNPKDMEYFQKMAAKPPRHARIVAFGSTRRVATRVHDDQNLKALLDARTTAVTLVGKSSVLHVQQVLQTDLAENLNMIAESVAYMKSHGKEVIFDAEHFFDGFRENPEYALKVLTSAQKAGADWLVLCDTNGGSLPEQISSVVKQVYEQIFDKIGIHCHNDGELAVANSMAAVKAGASQIQGTINGYGERCGNANLVSLIPNLQLKSGYQCIPSENVKKLSELSRTISEIANIAPDGHAPYVGAYAFAHKGGLHVAAVEKLTASYEHIDPQLIGNERKIIISELSGRGNVRMLSSQLGLKTNGNEKHILQQIKDMESNGYQFENAEGTVELIIRRNSDLYVAPFELISYSVLVRDNLDRNSAAEAVVKLKIKEDVFHTAAEGRGQVHALDSALRKALISSYPALCHFNLVDYKVRILDPHLAADATTRVIIEAHCGEEWWSTVGCSQNIIDASIKALMDSMELYLLRNQERSRDTKKVDRKIIVNTEAGSLR